MTTPTVTDPFHAEGTPGPDGRRVGVLLSHGFTGSPASIRPWAQTLADEGYAVDTREIGLEDSYHVATLDHDAPINERESVAFVAGVTGAARVTGTP